MHEDAFGEPSGPTELVVPLHAEQVTIERVRRETGAVRIATVTETREQRIEEPLSGERVDVVRVAIGTVVEAMPDVREEGGTTIIPVVEEILVIEKKLLLKEEIRITRERTSSMHRETILLREQHAVVTRTQGGETKLSAKPSINGDQHGQ